MNKGSEITNVAYRIKTASHVLQMKMVKFDYNKRHR